MPSNLDRTLEARAVRYQKLAGRLERAAAAYMLVASPVLAQDPDTIRAAPDTIVFELSPVEVLVSIAPRAAPSIGSGMPARISTVSRDQIDSWKPRLVTDLLSTQAGVSLYDDLGSPYKLNLSARGFNVGPTVGLPAGLSVFLDGIPQNEPAAQEVNFDLLPMEHVERVEFLRGNASLLGPNSLGGAVNLITRRGGEEARGEIELSAGSFAMKGGKANTSGRLLTNWDYYVGGGLEQESGWRDDTSAEWFNGLVNLGRTGRERGVRVQALWADSRAETAGSLPESLFEVDREVNFTAGDFEALELQQITAAGYRPLLSGRAALTAFFRRTNAERFNVNQPPEGDVRSLSQNNTVGGIGDWRRPLTLDGRPLSLRVGFDLAASWTRVRIFEEERDGTGRELMTDVESPSLDLAAYAMVDLEVDRAVLSAGARFDFIRIPFEDLLDPAADTVTNFTRISPRAGLSLDVGAGVRVFGSVGLSFRAPAILELACSDPEDACPLPFALGDDPPLDPVTATNYEVGAGWELDGADLAVSLYRTEAKNEIFFVPSEASVVEGFFRNLGRTHPEGVELEARAAPGSGLSLYANYAYTRATFQRREEIFSVRAYDDAEESELSSENLVKPGDLLPMIPEHQAKFGASYDHPLGVSLGFDGRFFGGQWLRGDEANESLPLDGYFIANGRVALRFDRWAIEWIIHNLFDTDDAMFGDLQPEPGKRGTGALPHPDQRTVIEVRGPEVPQGSTEWFLSPTQNPPTPPPPNPPPLKPPPPPLNPELPELLRGAVVIAAPVTVDMRDRASVNECVLNPRRLPPRYQSGGDRKMSSKALAQFFSTPKAIAYGRNFSNISGVRITRWKWSDFTRLRNSSNPRIRSNMRVPRMVRDGMNIPKAATITPVASPAARATVGCWPSTPSRKSEPRIATSAPLTIPAARNPIRTCFGWCR